MRIVAIIIGALLVDVAVQGTQDDFWKLLKGDFESSQQGNFIAWFAAILIIGMLGYVEPLRPVANSMLALLIIVLMLSHGGFFAQLKQQIGQQPAASAAR